VRGLTEDERIVLERWRRGIYEGVAGESPRFGCYCELYSRGLGVDVLREGPLGLGYYAACTPLGELALRADAAARNAGVWP
jgi:hypothetical protein